jgi:hypothetical protein
MAKHRKSTHRRRAGAVAIAGLGLALTGSLVGTPVEAVTLTPKSKNTTQKNADVVGTCRFAATRVTTNFVRFTLSATGRPAGLDGYRANVFTQTHCYVLDDVTFDVLIEYHPSVNGASMYGKNLKSSVPYFDSYVLCGQTEVKKQNGDTTVTPLVCA